MAQGYNVDVKFSQKRKKLRKSFFAVIEHFKAAYLPRKKQGNLDKLITLLLISWCHCSRE